MNEKRHTDTKHDIYAQMPLYMIAIFVLFDIGMMTVSVAAGVIGIIVTVIYLSLIHI